MKPLVLGCGVVMLAAGIAYGQEHRHTSEEPGKGGVARLGKVSFRITCSSGTQSEFETGVALLHSFWYEEAEKIFQQIAVQDANCAMAYWGQAMSIYRPLWVRLKEADIERGRVLMEKARAAEGKSQRESEYIEALSVLYQADGTLDYHQRTLKYCRAMQQVWQRYPDDHEAAVFYALALLASAPDNDTNLQNAREAITLLNNVFKAEPDHPGAAHYLIHAADNPQLAELGLPAARRYAEIAPSSPHALHMPSHIFARLGLWQEDIRSNLASLSAAEQPSAMHVGAEHRVHAMDFLDYAYLQTGDDADAKTMLKKLSTIKPEDVDPGLDGYLNQMRAHFSAMYALETHDWKMAEGLRAETEVEPYFQAITYWAQAIGAGHLRDAVGAQEAATKYAAALQATKRSKSAFRVQYMTTDSEEARAWLAFAQGKNEEAVGLLRSAADRQDAQGKGEVELPAREMLGDMLLEMGQPLEASHEYEKSLKTDPNRFNGLYGAAQAAKLSGRPETEHRYLEQLVANCKDAPEPQRMELIHARALLEKKDVEAGQR
jgi:tetratricopeptide (TPR) repeat protein